MKNLLLVLSLMTTTVGGFAAELHVAPGGDDANPGTALKPLRSLVAARDRIRTAHDGLASTVWLHGGRHELAATLELTPQDSGITWKAVPGETPVISGGRRVTGWQPHEKGIWKAKVAHQGKIRQLYVGDAAAFMAEGPTLRPVGWCGKFVIKGDEPWAADGPGEAPDGLSFKKVELPAVANPADLELQQQMVWTIQRVGFRGREDGGENWNLLFDQPGAAAATKLKWGCGLTAGKGSPLFNAYEFIDQPGEFYYDTKAGWLYYLPRPGEDLAKTEVLVPELETLVRIQGDGTAAHAVTIRFEGLTFAHTAFSMMKFAGCDSRANVCVQSSAYSVMHKNSGNAHVEPWNLYATLDVAPAAVFASNAGALAFHRNIFRLLACVALNLENDVAGAEVTGNVFQGVEGACVNIGHPQHSYIGKQNGDNMGWGPYHIDNRHDKWGDAAEGLVRDTTVANNLFRNVCWNLIQMIPVTLYAGHNIHILHNDIQDTPYSGITSGWNWSECNGLPQCGGKQSQFGRTNVKPSLSMSGLEIRDNRIVNPNLKLMDSANLYFVGDQARQSKNPIYQAEMAVVSGNYLVQEKARQRTDLIGCDEGTSYIRIEGNVMDGDHTGVSSVLHRGMGDRCKLFMNNWVASREMENDANFKDKNCIVALNHFVKRPAGTALGPDGWPAPARQIIQNAGLEPAYRDLFQKQ